LGRSFSSEIEYILQIRQKEKGDVTQACDEPRPGKKKKKKTEVWAFLGGYHDKKNDFWRTKKNTAHEAPTHLIIPQ
jgi:hypothetical protein